MHRKGRNIRSGAKFLKHTMKNRTFHMQSGLSGDNLIIYKNHLSPHFGVYGIFNKTKCKLYIGSTTNLQARKKMHEQYLKRGKHPCKEMQKDFINNDVFAFHIFEEFKEIAPDDLAGLEETYIKKLNTWDGVIGYNKIPVVFTKTLRKIIGQDLSNADRIEISRLLRKIAKIVDVKEEVETEKIDVVEVENDWRIFRKVKDNIDK